MSENEFKCQCAECQMRFMRIEQIIEELRKGKLDSDIWKSYIASIEKEIYQLSSKFDNLNHVVIQHDEILSKMKESIDIIREKILKLDEEQVISNADVKIELNKISDTLGLFQERYIDKFDEINELIKVKLHESKTVDWRSTLVDRFNIGNKFAILCKISIGIIVGGLSIGVVGAIITFLVNYSSILEKLIK